MNIVNSTLTIPNDPTPWMLIEPTNQKDFCVLWLQGWNATIKKHEKMLVTLAEQTGMTFATLDYAGHGTHPTPLEETTREQQFNEALAAYDALKTSGYKHIIVAGTSFGGYLAALLSEKRDPYAIILRAAAIYPNEEFTMPYQERNERHAAYQMFKHTVTAASDLTALQAVKRFKGSAYVVEHEIDSVIPKNILQAYFANTQRGNYMVVPATDHSLRLMSQPEKHYAYIESLTAAILRLVQLEESLPDHSR